eukprot:230113-Chlamydomonas_euryale.AAC.1
MLLPSGVLFNIALLIDDLSTVKRFPFVCSHWRLVWKGHGARVQVAHRLIRLSEACKVGRKMAVRLLLKNVNARPIHFACENGHTRTPGASSAGLWP